jgi:DNA-binding CsgD family transcriptional regulator
LEVFRLVGLGGGPSSIAEELGISVKTVETHQLRIKEKLKLRSANDLKKRAELWWTTTYQRSNSRKKWA